MRKGRCELGWRWSLVAAGSWWWSEVQLAVCSCCSCKTRPKLGFPSPCATPPAFPFQLVHQPHLPCSYSFFRPFLAPEIITAFYGTRHKKHWCGGEQKNNNTFIELLIARDQAYQLFHNRITLISTFIYIQKSYHHSFCVITSCTN